MDSYPVLLGLKPANCVFDVFVAVALLSMEKLPFLLQALFCSSTGIDPPLPRLPSLPPPPPPHVLNRLRKNFKK